MHATTYLTLADAEVIAARNTAFDEEGWTYTVVPCGSYYVVQVRDETGFLVGNL